MKGLSTSVIQLWEQQKQLMLFLGLSLLLVLRSANYVWQSYDQHLQSYLRDLEAEGENFRRFNEAVYELILRSMTESATMVAYDHTNAEAFEKGVKALAEEGGGKGGLNAARHRSELLAHLQPTWTKMTEEFQVRQLHFHAPPGDTSFLRVHQPEMYGDDLSSIRHIIVDAMNDQQPKSGFELGRVYSGIRSVVPVFSPSDNQHFIGVVEAGTSFENLASLLRRLTDSHVAVLMNAHQVDEAMWDRSEEQFVPMCNCYIEATTSEDTPLLRRISEVQFQGGQSFDPKLTTQIIAIDGLRYAITSFGIQDYINKTSGSNIHVGQVLSWKPVEEGFDELTNQAWGIAASVIIGLFLFEIALYKGLQFGLRSLQREIDNQTQDIKELNSRLVLLANHDGLTGLLNRREVMTRFEALYNLSKRYSHDCSVIMLDIDHFKKVNDSYGHQAGDEVLKRFAQVISKERRNTDLVGRYGGEEFLVVLAGTDLETAKSIAETIRVNVERSNIRPEKAASPITCSLGVADTNDTENINQTIARADEALYNAKGEGRNRVVSYENQS